MVILSATLSAALAASPTPSADQMATQTSIVAEAFSVDRKARSRIGCLGSLTALSGAGVAAYGAGVGRPRRSKDDIWMLMGGLAAASLGLWIALPMYAPARR